MILQFFYESEAYLQLVSVRHNVRSKQLENLYIIKKLYLLEAKRFFFILYNEL